MLLYIDPGTGSMLFSILIGLVTTLFFLFRKFIIKFKFFLHGGKVQKSTDSKIPFVVFADSKRYWNVFKPICDEFEARGVAVQYWTVDQDDPALNHDYKSVSCIYVGTLNQAFAKLNMMNACICLSTTPGLDVYQWKRSKDTNWYVHILHAAGDVTAYRMFGLDYYDAVMLAGGFQEQQIRALEDLRELKHKELPVIGLTYMDSMLRRLNLLEKNSSSQVQNKENAELTVLLAPTWGKSGILNRYGEKIINALIDTGFNIVVRPHPQSVTSEKELLERLQKCFSNEQHLSWNYDNDNFNILSESDIMISDFSGVIFDYSLVFDKPIIYADTNYDAGPYDSWWLHEPMWIFETLPKIGIQLKEEEFSNLKHIILSAVNSEHYRDARKNAREETWANVGNSASLAVDYLIGKYNEMNPGFP